MFLLQVPPGYSAAETQGQSCVIEEEVRKGQKEYKYLQTDLCGHVSHTCEKPFDDCKIISSGQTLAACSLQVRIFVETTSSGSPAVLLSLGGPRLVPVCAFQCHNLDLLLVAAS